MCLYALISLVYIFGNQCSLRMLGFMIVVLLFFLQCVSFKKSNNAQGGQSRVSSVGVNPDPNYASAARTTQNGAHSQPSVHGMTQ